MEKLKNHHFLPSFLNKIHFVFSWFARLKLKVWFSGTNWRFGRFDPELLELFRLCNGILFEFLACLGKSQLNLS